MVNMLKQVVLVGLATAAATEANAEVVTLDVALGKPAMMANQRQTAYLKVGLTGDALQEGRRTPVNLALVLDRSSSMNGQKIAKAKEAAIMVLDRLSSEDIVSVITYDSGVEVLVPSTRLDDVEMLKRRIRAIRPRGSTALFAGVSKGIAEVRKFLDDRRVNRVILLSDGMANIGPSSPNALGQLGAACRKEGISVTTIGLGLSYNEDLMVQLAQRSDGNHGYAHSAANLASIFDAELGDVLSVVAQEVSVKMTMPEGVKPVRILNRDGEIFGQEIVFAMNQLYQKQQKFVLVEVELPPGAPGSFQNVADVHVSYSSMETGSTERVNGTARVEFTANEREVARRENREVMIAAVEAIAVERNKNALALRDKGEVDKAELLLEQNAKMLKKKAHVYRSTRLQKFSRGQLRRLQEPAWQGLESPAQGDAQAQLRDRLSAELLVRRLALLILLLVLVPVGAMAWLGTKVAADRRAVAAAQFSSLTHDRLRDLASAISSLRLELERSFSDKLEGGIGKPRELRRAEPLFAQVFELGADGAMRFPRSGAEASEEERDFLVRTAAIWKSEAILYTPPETEAPTPKKHRRAREQREQRARRQRHSACSPRATRLDPLALERRTAPHLLDSADGWESCRRRDRTHRSVVANRGRASFRWPR